MRLGVAMLAGCLLLATVAAAADRAEPDACLPHAQFGRTWTPIPGFSWSSWASLLGRTWTDEQAARPGWFETAHLIDALQWMPDYSYAAPDTLSQPEWKHPDLNGASDDALALYYDAAALFSTYRFSDAITAFDRLSAEPDPVGAASAYSAARSAYDAGDPLGGLQRTGTLFERHHDPEIVAAAHDLLGTMEWQTDAPPLLAARLEEISHLITAPAPLRCAHPELGEIEADAIDDLNHITTFAYPSTYWADDGWAPPRREVFDIVGQHDPVIDLVRVLAIPSPYALDRPWLNAFDPRTRNPGFPHDDTASAKLDQLRVLALRTARDRAGGGTPIWAFAVAQLTADLDDLPLLDQAAQSLATASIPTNDRDDVRAWLAAQAIRLLLTKDRLPEARSRLTQSSALLTKTVQGNVPAVLGALQWDVQSSAGEFVAVGGIRALLAQKDLAGARRWAEATAPLFGVSFDHAWLAGPLGLALARDWQDVIEPGLANDNPPIPTASAAVLDLLPSDRIEKLARTPGLALNWRRAMLTAVFTRRAALGEDRAAMALAPDMRDFWPEMAPALNGITGAWLPSTRHHRLMLLLAREPGLSPRVLWARDIERVYGQADPKPLSTLDRDDPNDGNWWCPLDVGRARTDAFAGMFQSLSLDWSADPTTFSGVSLEDSAPAPDRAEVDTWLALSPLFHGIDGSELQRLSGVHSTPFMLSTEALRWLGGSNLFSRLFGLDDQIADALALGVRATRYGCRRAEPLGGVSRAAWAALHTHFPDTPAARRTPFWFDETAHLRPSDPRSR